MKKVLITGSGTGSYRNLEPKSMLDETKHLIEAPWTKKVRDGLGTRPAKSADVL